MLNGLYIVGVTLKGLENLTMNHLFYSGLRCTFASVLISNLISICLKQEKKITEDEILKGIELYNEGMGINAVCKTLEVSRVALLDGFKERGISLRSGVSKLTKEQEDLIIRLKKEGKTIAAIEQETGISHKGIYSTLKRRSDSGFEFIDQDKRDKVLDLHKSGMNLTDISKKMGIEYTSVAGIVRREVPRKPSPTELVDVDGVIRMYVEENENTSYIAKKYGVRYNKIEQILRENGIQLRESEIEQMEKYRKEKWPYHEGCIWVAKNKKDGSINSDYLNTSGNLAASIVKRGGKKYDRREGVKFFRENGYMWYEQYVDIIEVNLNDAAESLSSQKQKVLCDELIAGAKPIGLMKKYNIPKQVIAQVGINHGIELWDDMEDIPNLPTVEERFPKHEGRKWIAVSKTDGTTYDDYLNKSGALSEYVAKHFTDVIPDERKRKRIYEKTGKLWQEHWFDIIEVDEYYDREEQECPICHQKLNMYRMGDYKRLIEHIKNEHGLSVSEQWKKFNEWKSFHTYLLTHMDLMDDPSMYVVCKECGKRMRFIDPSHLMKVHNMTKDDYIMKYGNDGLICDDYKEFLSNKVKALNETMDFRRVSNDEVEIKDELEKVGIKVEASNRKILNSKEIDLYIESMKIGIEYNGLPWHTEIKGGKYPYYHYDKMFHCKQHGISLIQIFGDELVRNKNAVIQELYHLLGVQHPQINVDEMRINWVPFGEVKDFISENSFEYIEEYGETLKASINGKTIGVAGISVYNGIPTFEYVASKIGTLNKWKIMKCMADAYMNRYNQYQSILYYQDKRWETDKVYNEAKDESFVMLGDTKPDYWYYVSRNKDCRIPQYKMSRNLLVSHLDQET